MPHMKTAVAAPTSARSTIAPSVLRVFGPTFALLALVWLEIVRHLAAEWNLNPQYGYGWSVPFLMLYLLWKRWPERPLPDRPRSLGIGIALLIACVLAFAPIRFVAEANPDWRLVSWAMALLAVTMSILLVYLHGGARWVRHFAFPFLFFLVAVPWPTLFETALIQNLMRAVTAINVVFLNLVGVPALQHGNVIEVASGLIGIEEACSGVRSLQATLMISLFLGDLYSFNFSRRLLLIAAGAVLAFICNVGRTAILVWIGAHRGAHAIEAWHDPAGLTILLICLFGLWMLSVFMRRRFERRTGSTAPSFRKIDNQLSPAAIPSTVFVGAIIALLMMEAGVQFWYRANERNFTASHWTVHWPTNENGYKSVPIAPEAAGLLHYNDGGGAAWETTDGRQWMMYFFRWLPGQTAARFVKIHRPDICLPASGMTIRKDAGIRFVDVNGLKLPMRSYRFDDHGAPLHVFYCYWDARSSYENATAAEEEDWSARGRVRAALRGRRDLGAQMLELVVWGYDDDAQADAALQQQLTRLIERG
jgi:exosortase